MHVPAQSYIFADMKQIPDIIKKEADHLVARFGNGLKYLGKRGKVEYYGFSFPEDCDTGFPVVYQYEGGKVLELSGFAALDIIRLFVKD